MMNSRIINIIGSHPDIIHCHVSDQTGALLEFRIIRVVSWIHVSEFVDVNKLKCF